ncbi:MAG: hypothetical protein IJ565_05645 [Bacilli bacterium]|nr:hypothetical protein [Bacilli bacterium]
MIVSKYENLKNIKDNMLIDISKLSVKLRIRVIDYLAGYTKDGSLTKIDKNKYLVRKEI